MKNLNVPLPDSYYEVFKRLARYERRSIKDFLYLILDDGLTSYYCERYCSITKLDPEYTKEETDQIAKNAELEKTKGWKKLSWDEKQSRGYDPVDNNWREVDLNKFASKLADLITDDAPFKNEEVKS